MELVDSLQNLDGLEDMKLQIARHAAQIGDYLNGERLYLEIGKVDMVIEMYLRAKKWETAHGIAIKFLKPEEIKGIFVSLAQRFEKQGILKVSKTKIGQ